MTRRTTLAEIPEASTVTRPYLRLLKILGLALAYFLTGKLGTFLAIEPGYATTIWPPSGIALAGILLFGYRAWPGIFAGSVLVNLSTTLAGSHGAEITIPLIIVFIIGVAAVVQAITGAYLVRRFGRFPNHLTSEKEVFSFMVFGGVLSTLINPTIAVSTLNFFGRISLDDFVANWLTWWAGDAIGVFIFAPLVLVWMLRPVEVWRNRRVVISLVLTTAFALIAMVMVYAAQQEKRQLDFKFENDSGVMMLELQKSLSMHLGILGSVRNYFSASENVTREEFDSFTLNSLDNLSGVEALTWNPRIRFTQRDHFEQSVRNEGYHDFRIMQANKANAAGKADQLVKADARAEYFPTLFIDSNSDKLQTLGYDLYSDATLRKAMEISRDSGEVEISLYTGLAVANSKNVLLAFIPIYTNGLNIRTVDERRQALSGYVVASLNLESIVNAAFKNVDAYRLPLKIIDKSVLNKNQLIFHRDQLINTTRLFRELGLIGWAILSPRKVDFSIAGHVWQLEIYPTQQYVTANRSGNAAFILLIGLLLSGVVGSLVMIRSGRDNMLQRLVDKRTFELQASYDQLDKLSREVPGFIYQFKQYPDGHFSFPYASVGISDVYEVTPEQVKHDAAPVFANLHPKDYAGVVKSIKDSAQNLTPWRYEYRVNLPQKGVRWLLGHANPEKLQDGSVIWHGFITDITAQKAAQTKLRMLSAAIEQSPTSVVISNLNAEIEYVNPYFTKVTGYSQDEVMGKNPSVLQSGLTDQSVYPEMWAAISKGRNWVGNFVNKRKNGEVYYEEAYISPVHDIDGTPSHYVAVKLDITERKKLEDSIHAAARYTRSLIESSLDPLVTISVDGMITDVNFATENVIGLSRNDLIGTEFAKYFTEPEKARAGYQQVFAKGSVTGYMLAIQHVSGIVTDVLYNASVYRDEAGKVLGVFAAARDITDLKHMQEEMRELAFHDPLTMLPNRRLLIDRISQAIAASKRSGMYGAMMFLDLDNFKPLNDTYGHGVGDLLLIEVARRLKACSRATDTVARIGGDEFVVMLTKLDKEYDLAKSKAEKIAEKIRLALAKPYTLLVDGEDKPESTVEHHCTASIGVVLFLSDSISRDDVMKWADSAMYQAKDAGRNRVLFYTPDYTEPDPQRS